MCPHCIYEWAVAFMISLPVIGFGIRWIKNKLHCNCDCHKENHD